MKTIYLLRHAKSSWENADLADFDRPLNRRGLENAPAVGGKIYENKFRIDSIISSPAKRAKHTAILVREAAQIESPIRFEERIYEASPQSLLKVASETGDDKISLLLVGHNPGLEGFIKLLTGETREMPTAALAVIYLKIGRWNEIKAGCGELQTLITPKSLD
jgi:phosphohistidine phosphatase